MKSFNFIFILLTALTQISCHSSGTKQSNDSKPDEIGFPVKDTIHGEEKNEAVPESLVSINDTLTQLANFISGSLPEKQNLFKHFTNQQAYTIYQSQIQKKWKRFDSIKLKPIQNFVNTEFNAQINSKKIFYPFSGPDILYSSTLFPNGSHFTLIGLEPVGTLPIIDDKEIEADSVKKYFDKINSSLYAILNFSFFRTISMKEDLRNEEVDGTIHLLLLFLTKTGHEIVSIKPFYIDSIGVSKNVENTIALKQKKYKNPSIEIIAVKNNKLKTVTYTSADLSNSGLQKNNGLKNFISTLGFESTYLKGASYLMHEKSFSGIRNLILNNSQSVIQDDSGIALKYFNEHSSKWDYYLYGTYTKPIQIFKHCYQHDLDSLYKKSNPKPLGFGLGYNYRDKNSNFMLIKKQSI